ncbi:MAG: hypothetical protein R3D62_03410 [Xanthobacteraceae bacterium]
MTTSPVIRAPWPRSTGRLRGQWWIGLFDRMCRLVPGCRPRRQHHDSLHADDGEPVAI